MTSQLANLLNLPDPEENTPTPEEVIEDIKENELVLANAEDISSKIDTSLQSVTDLDITDNELDELSALAKKNYEELIDLGMNVEARFSGAILQTSGNLLGHAISAKQAKIDRKLRTIDLQIKKMRLDQISPKKSDGDKIVEAEDGQGVVLDRNELLRSILNKSNK